jgi:hypothetical protein
VLIRLSGVAQCFPEQSICTSAVWLIDAIRVERNLGDSESGTKLAMEIASSNATRSFAFKNPRAFDMVKPQYTCQQLDEVRDALKTVSISSLRNQLRVGKGKVHQLYQDSGRFSYRDAVGQILLERGIHVAVDERTKSLDLRD